MNEMILNSTFFGVAITLLAYEAGVTIRRKWKLAILNPLLLAIIFVMLVLAVTRLDYAYYEEGAKYLSYLLTPATISLAIPLHQQMQLLRKNKTAILCGVTSGVLSGLCGVLLCAILFHLSHEEYVTLLPKSITNAIGMAVSEELGGMVSITVATIILTGIFGNIIAETACHFLRIHEPIARGIAIGTSSHAMGTAKAMEMGEIEGAMSSLSIAVSGLLTVLFASLFALFY